MTAEHYSPPPPDDHWGDGPSDADLAAQDAEAIAERQRLALAEDIEREARKIRVHEAARAKVQAEKLAATNFEDQYLSRSSLLDLPDPEPLIEHVLPRHAYAILRGRDHSFKSFVAIDWALCLATGKPWQGHQVQPTPVIYIAGEGAHGLAKRIEAWEYAWGRNVPDHMFTLRRTALNLHLPGPAFTDLLERITTAGYGLVVIDTLRRVSGAADGNSSEMGLVIDNIDRIKQATTAGTVLTVAHTDKGDHDTRGYSGIEDDADVVWAAKRDENYLTLDLTKMKDGPDGRQINLEAKRTGPSLILSGFTGLPQPNTTESQLKILDTLRTHAIDGMAPTALLKASGLSESTFYRAIKALHEAGQIQNLGTPNRKLWALPALNVDSHDSHTPEPAPDLHVSHDSQPLPLPPPTTPTTPTTLRSGSEREESERQTDNTHNDTHPNHPTHEDQP